MTDPSPPESPPEPEGGVPWITPQIQTDLRWRDGDVVVSAPVKSGTTWMMNIVHQLRSGGDREFERIDDEVPWLEFLAAPSIRPEHVIARLDALPSDRRRVFKTHSPPPLLPYQDPRGEVEVKYVVVVRNPEEALVSLVPFVNKHTEAWFELWGMEPMRFPDFETYFREFVAETGFHKALLGFVAAWWPLREQANVLLVHFSDLRRAPEQGIRRVAEFLGFRPTPTQWPTILECSSFPWMKANTERFERWAEAPVPVLEHGSMVRKGAVGAAYEDGMTEAIAAQVRADASAMLDADALRWCYRGEVS